MDQEVVMEMSLVLAHWTTELSIEAPSDWVHDLRW